MKFALTEYFIKHPTLFWSLMVALLIAGVLSFVQMPKLEDPAIGVKQAMVVIVYPGATAHEVELQVAQVMEDELRTIPNVKKISSECTKGMAQITVEFQETVLMTAIEQHFDQLVAQSHERCNMSALFVSYQVKFDSPEILVPYQGLIILYILFGQEMMRATNGGFPNLQQFIVIRLGSQFVFCLFFYHTSVCLIYIELYSSLKISLFLHANRFPCNRMPEFQVFGMQVQPIVLLSI